MNSFKIWIKAQLYNALIAFVIFFVSTIYQSMQLIENTNVYDNSNIHFKYLFNILVLFIFYSFFGGLPLIGLFKLVEMGINNSTLNSPSKQFLEKIAYPTCTLLYIIMISYLLQLNNFIIEIKILKVLWISTPSITCTLISVLVNQYNFKKNQENELP